MPLSSVALQNLHRDRHVLGAAWLSTYNRYFSDERVFDAFIHAARPVLEKLPGRPRILYAGSASGELGERIANFLRERGKKPELTLVDVSREHLALNTNPSTRRILRDVLDLDLSEKFDLAIMRSTLDYFPTPDLQVAVLKRIHKHLAPGGVFLNQATSLPSKTERDLANAVYATTPKIGRRHFQWKGDLPFLYRKAGFENFTHVGEAPSLTITNQEHAERYRVSKKEIAKIRRVISSVRAARRPNLHLTREGYRMRWVFPIYAARKPT